jgi:hypothetical protein
MTTRGPMSPTTSHLRGTPLPFGRLDQSPSEEEGQMERHSISTENAPAALGPYSEAIVANGFRVLLRNRRHRSPDRSAPQWSRRADGTSAFELGRHSGACGILHGSARQDDDLLRQRRRFRHYPRIVERPCAALSRDVRSEEVCSDPGRRNRCRNGAGSKKFG